MGVYGGGSAANGARLLKVVNFATRVVTGLEKYDHVSRARVELDLCTPRQMCDMQSAIVAHKASVLDEPAELAALFSTYADARTHERVTRQDLHLWPPSRRTAAGQRSFANHAAKLLNALPEDLRGVGTAAFKREVKRFYLHDAT